MVRFRRSPRSDDPAGQHDAETRLFEPVHQATNDDPADLSMPGPVYPTSVTVASNYRAISGDDRAVAAARLNSVIRLLFALLEALIAIRFALKAMGANAGAPFTTLIYSVTDPFVGPFIGVVASPALGRYVFEFPALLAILIYFLLSLLITRLIRVLFIDQPRIYR